MEQLLKDISIKKKLMFGEYLRNLTAYLTRSYSRPAVQLQVDADGLSLPLDRPIPSGLIVNELVSNCLKHAFPGERRGRIWVDFHQDPSGKCTLRVKDDGVGFPEGYDLRTTGSLGLQLVQSLTDQLGGRLEVDRAGGLPLRSGLGAGEKDREAA